MPLTSPTYAAQPAKERAQTLNEKSVNVPRQQSHVRRGGWRQGRPVAWNRPRMQKHKRPAAGLYRAASAVAAHARRRSGYTAQPPAYKHSTLGTDASMTACRLLGKEGNLIVIVFTVEAMVSHTHLWPACRVPRARPMADKRILKCFFAKPDRNGTRTMVSGRWHD
jgi:hypothetical protein